MKEKRSFKGVWIPKEIWESENLSLQEKVFLVEIDSLDNDTGCFASNNYFAEFFKVSRQRCSQIINSLEKKKLITIDLLWNGKEVDRRIIKVVNKFDRGVKYPIQGCQENLPRCQEKLKDNNTINNTINNKYNVEDFSLAELLLKLILDNTPTFKEPDLSKWAEHIRLMRERDNRTYEQIEYVIRWAQSSNFWQPNILSTKKLREKFDTLVAQIKREKNNITKII